MSYESEVEKQPELPQSETETWPQEGRGENESPATDDEQVLGREIGEIGGKKIGAEISWIKQIK
jgi:hypothetical protein